MTSARDLSRARTLLELRRPDEALAIVAAVLAAEPDNLEAVLLGGECHAAADRPEDLLDAARRAVSMAPQSVAAHLALTNAYYLLDRHHEGRSAAEIAVNLSPHDWSTHYMLSRSLSAGQDPLPARALLAAREAMRLAPYAADPHVAAGLAFTRLSMRRQARDAYREALRLDPGNQYALGNLSVLMSAGGKFASASDHVRAGLAIDPQATYLQETYLLLVVRLCFAFTGIHILGAVAIGVGVDQGMAWWARFLIAAALVGTCGVVITRVSNRLPGRARTQLAVLTGQTNGAQKFLLAVWLTSALVLLTLGLAPAPVIREAGTLIADAGGDVPWSQVLLGLALVSWASRATRRK